MTHFTISLIFLFKQNQELIKKALFTIYQLKETAHLFSPLLMPYTISALAVATFFSHGAKLTQSLPSFYWWHTPPLVPIVIQTLISKSNIDFQNTYIFW